MHGISRRTTPCLLSASYLFLLIQSLNVQQLEARRYKMVDTSAYSISSATLTQQEASGLIQCAARCSAAHACYAYQYNSVDKSCYIGGDVSFTGASLDANTRLFMTGFDQRMSCSSNGYARRECSATSPVVTVTLALQISKSPCTPGTSFGVTSTGNVWVSSGCRGEFEVRF